MLLGYPYFVASYRIPGTTRPGSKSILTVGCRTGFGHFKNCSIFGWGGDSCDKVGVFCGKFN